MTSTEKMQAAEQIGTSEMVEYLLDIGGTLLSYGCPTHRLEGLITAIARDEGYQAEIFAVPTGLWMMLRGPGNEPPQTRMLRVKEWAVDLARLAAIDRIFNDVLDRRMPLQEARRRIDEVEAAPPPYPGPARWLGVAAASGASAVFFRGGWEEVAIGTLGGAMVAALSALLSRTARARLLNDFLGGLVAGLLAWVATSLRPGLSREVVVLSTVILLVPGMALTSGLAELAHKNLVSGAARLMEAMMTFLSILLGIAVAVALEKLAGAEPGAVTARLPPGLMARAAAILVTSLGISVLFSVPRRILPLALLSGATSFVATGLGARYLPGSLSAFVASTSVCLLSNALARFTQRPAQIFLLPGLVLLVPGSFGFRSLEAFLRGELAGGATSGFEMFLIAGAIVVGLLVGNVLLPARKHL